MATILSRASRNFLWQHPWQLLLALLGITLGVAVVVAIDLAMTSSLRVFEQATRMVSGQSTHQIIAGPGGFDEKLYTRLRVQHGIPNLSPVIKGRVGIKQLPRQGFNLLGVDLFIESGFNTLWQQTDRRDEGARFSLLRLLTDPDAVLISPNLANRLDLQVNDTLNLVTPSGERRLVIMGLLSSASHSSGIIPEDLLIVDLATAQELLGLFGKLTRIDIKLAQDRDHATELEVIKSALPANAQLISAEQEIAAAREMSRAFSINLNALGLLSVLIGMFLIYNTMTFLVVQRRELFGSLRALGVTRQEVLRLIVLEALGLAAIGSLIGIPAGIVIGHGLIELVSSTISNFYFQTQASALQVTWQVLLKGLALGFIATLLAVMLPAWEAIRLSPVSVMRRSQLESGARKMVVMAGSLSVVCMLAGLLLAVFSGKSISLGISSVFFLLFGFALLTPALTLLIANVLKYRLNSMRSILARLPARMLSAEISRTGVAIAALMVAISATVGMELMISSFRQTVAQWLNTSMRAELYVALPGDNTSPDKIAGDRQLAERINALDEVAMISTVLHTQVLAAQQIVPLSVFQLNAQSKAGFMFRHRLNKDFWRNVEQTRTVLVTESYAYHHDVSLGDRIDLRTRDGLKYFTVIGIYTDYSGDQGHLAMSRGIYQMHWGNAGCTGIGVYAGPGADLTRLQETIVNLGGSDQALQVRSNREIFTESMQLFDQTFVITRTLRWLAAGIAFVGVFGALMALQFERTWQLGVLRAIGVTPQQLGILMIGETGLMGLIAGILAVPAGLGVAALLLFVVYQRSFGWTMAFHIQPVLLLQGLVWAVIAALLAGVLPAVKMAKTRPAQALRTE